MTPDKQRIAIAEACGLKCVRPPSKAWSDATLRPEPGTYWLEPGWDDPLFLPDYLNDLNAMHEAENTLNYNQRVIFINFLGVALVREKKPKLPEMTKCIHVEACHAAAAQRAEAFLRTIGKWEDS